MRDEKKIAKNGRAIRVWLGEIEKNYKKLQQETSEHKREKIKKKIETNKKDLMNTVKFLIQSGGELTEVVDGLNEFQTDLVKKLFPGGTDTNSVEIQKEITRIKKLLNEDLKKAMEKTDYNPADPIQDKMKNRRFSEEAHIGAHLASASRKNDFVGDGLNKEYNPYWNYQRDYESTKDKYFTEEEQRLIEKCRESHKEQYAYLLEKRAWMGKMGESLIETAGKMREWGDITQAKIWVKNLYEDAFPVMVREIHGKLPKAEAQEKAKEMTREYIRFLCDDEKIEELSKLYEEAEKEAEIIKQEVRNSKGNLEAVLGSRNIDVREFSQMVNEEVNGQSVLMLYILKERIGMEKTSFIGLYKYDPILEDRKKLLTKYSLEELGL